MDYRGFILDIDLEQYFKISIDSLDMIKHNKINSNKKSYRLKFQEITENIILATGINRTIISLKPNTATREELESIDSELTHIMNCARKQIEGPQRTVPYSKTKLKSRNEVLY